MIFLCCKLISWQFLQVSIEKRVPSTIKVIRSWELLSCALLPPAIFSFAIMRDVGRWDFKEFVVFALICLKKKWSEKNESKIEKFHWPKSKFYVSLSFSSITTYDLPSKDPSTICKIISFIARWWGVRIRWEISYNFLFHCDFVMKAVIIFYVLIKRIKHQFLWNSQSTLLSFALLCHFLLLIKLIFSEIKNIFAWLPLN